MKETLLGVVPYSKRLWALLHNSIFATLDLIQCIGHLYYVPILCINIVVRGIIAIMIATQLEQLNLTAFHSPQIAFESNTEIVA
jgi:hypothetical protein